MKEIVDEALARGAVGRARRRLAPLATADQPARSWDELPRELERRVETPYLLTYTSGTTGQPKGVVHVQGGFLVSIAREVAYQADARPDDVDPLRHRHGLDHGPVEGGRRAARWAARSSSPRARPTGRTDRLWGLVEQERVSMLGLSPTLMRALIPHGRAARPTSPRCARSSRPASRGTRSRTGGSSSEVGGGRCPIINCSGGTEVGACFLSPTRRDADQGVLARRAGARDGDGRRRRRGKARVRGRGRRARLPASRSPA